MEKIKLFLGFTLSNTAHLIYFLIYIYIYIYIFIVQMCSDVRHARILG